MPIIQGYKRLGSAVDLSFTQQPKPVFIDQKRLYPRERRSGDPTAMNMILNETRVDNDLEKNEHRWANNGFKGNVQFITYFGTNPIRPGIKLERDLQQSTFPKENSKPLNTSQMRNPECVMSEIKGRPVKPGHLESLETLKEWRRGARRHEKKDNAYGYQYPIPDMTKAPNLKDMQPAGRASIFPSLGTSGSLPELKHLQEGKSVFLAGKELLDTWRMSTPFAYDHFRTKTWPYPNDPL